MDLNKKRILFISPCFFDYEKILEKELITRGAHVIFLPSVIQKNIFLHLPLTYKFFQKKYREKLLYIYAQKYDYLFVIKGDNIDFDLLQLFNKNNPAAMKILYLYDALLLYPKTLNIFIYFDKVYSFDLADCSKYNLIYRPLFYINDYLFSTMDEKYDIASISSYYPNRLTIFNEFKKKYPSLSLYFRIYTGWRSLFRGRLSVYIKNFDLFSIIQLSSKKVVKILSKSKAILDIPHEMQNGLTIRTFETLALKKKLITTNKNILQTDFYNSNNIFILDNNYTELEYFLKIPYKEIPPAILERYSVKHFIDTLFS